MRPSFKIQASQSPPKWRNGRSINPRSTSLCPSTAPRSPTGGHSGDQEEDDVRSHTVASAPMTPLSWAITLAALRRRQCNFKAISGTRPSASGLWGAVGPSYLEGEPLSPLKRLCGRAVQQANPLGHPKKTSLSLSFLAVWPPPKNLKRVRHC